MKRICFAKPLSKKGQQEVVAEVECCPHCDYLHLPAAKRADQLRHFDGIIDVGGCRSGLGSGFTVSQFIGDPVELTVTKAPMIL